MISAVVQKLRIIQALRWLTLRLLDGSIERRDSRCARRKDVSYRHYNHDPYLEVFHRLCWQLLFRDRLPAFYLPDLQENEDREKNNKDQRHRESLASEAELRESIQTRLMSFARHLDTRSNNLIDLSD